MPSPEQTEKIKNRIDTITDLVYVVNQGTHGERHGPKERQYRDWKAQDATTNVKKRGYSASIEKLNRNMNGLSSTAFS